MNSGHWIGQVLPYLNSPLCHRNALPVLGNALLSSRM